MFVTGPKYDIWLVKTVGLLITSIGTTTLIASREKSIAIHVIFLTVSSACFLTAIDIYYSLTGRISKIYIGDALIEIMLVILILYAYNSQKESNHRVVGNEQ
jgi:hypothetical protein